MPPWRPSPFTSPPRACPLRDSAAASSTPRAPRSQQDPEFNPGRIGIATLVTSETLSALPTLTRNFIDFAVLSPLARVSKDGVSVVGANYRFNTLNVDGALNQDVFGLSTNNIAGGRAGGRVIPLEAVEQFQLEVAPFDIRQSGFTGGALNAVTKSGTNEFRDLRLRLLPRQRTGRGAGHRRCLDFPRTLGSRTSSRPTYRSSPTTRRRGATSRRSRSAWTGRSAISVSRALCARAPNFFAHGNGLEQRVVQLTNNLSHDVGSHQLLFGASGTWFFFDRRFVPGALGSYEFGSLEDLALNRPDRYEITIPLTAQGEAPVFRVQELALYAQDEWEAHDRLVPAPHSSHCAKLTVVPLWAKYHGHQG